MPSSTTYAYPARTASRTALRSFGARAASSSTVSPTYRQAVVVPIPNPAASSANVSPNKQVSLDHQGLPAGVQLRQGPG